MSAVDRGFQSGSAAACCTQAANGFHSWNLFCEFRAIVLHLLRGACESLVARSSTVVKLFRLNYDDNDDLLNEHSLFPSIKTVFDQTRNNKRDELN
jgi:hypothetical protein